MHSRLGCNKIALGHHYDDVIETILMGMLWGAQVQTMMPKLHSTNFPGMELIRPLYLIREDDIKAWRDANELHFIQCACRFTDTCTTCRPNQETRSKRQEIKELILHAEAAQSGCGGAYFPLRGDCESRHRHRLEDRRKKIQLSRPL